MKRMLISALLGVTLLAGCSPSISGGTILKQVKVEDTQINAKIDSETRQSIFDLSNELTGAFFASSEDPNQAFSPLSLWYALGVLREGANGETLAELNRMMKLPQGFDSSKTIPDLSKSLNFMTKKDGVESGLRVTNGIFLDQKYRDKILDDYLKKSTDIWGTDVAAVDFTKETETKEIIRDWVKDKTNGFIPNYEPSFQTDGSNVLNIYNALYLKDAWVNSFNRTTDVPFKTAQGEVKIPFFGATTFSKSYYTSPEAEAVSLSGETGLNVWFILPKEGSDPASALPHLKDILASENPQTVEFKAPVLSFESPKVSIKDLLVAKGYGTIFGTGDFSKLLKDQEVQVGNISQKTKLEMDEKGFEAAAVTEISAEATAVPDPKAPPKFIVNRPFLYVIEYQGLPLLIGRVTDPSK